jgi:hypothetical protein
MAEKPPAERVAQTGALRTKRAPTDMGPWIVSVQSLVPEQAPLQPAKRAAAPGWACSWTLVPRANAAAQVPPQAIPPGRLVTVPAPFPDFVTWIWSWIGSKRAVTDVACCSVTLQAPCPLQASDQPANWEFPSGWALSWTVVPRVKEAVHVEPQEIPAGWLVTVPPPAPVLVTRNSSGESSKTALIEVVRNAG